MMAYETEAEVLKTGDIDPELQKILASISLPKVNYSDLEGFVASANARSSQVVSLLGAPPEGVKESEILYTTRDHARLRAKLYQPSVAPDGGSPLVLLFHGGGFCTGLPEGESQTARNLVQAFGVVCVSASYRLAPTFPFPYAVNDAWDALKWVAKNAADLGAQPALGFIVGGSSAGANLSAVLTHLARDASFEPPLTGQYLAVPTVCDPNSMPEKYRDKYWSWKQNREAPVLSVAAVNMLMKGYNADNNDAVHFAILNNPKGHANLPPAYIAVDGLDPLRDHGLIYERVLKEEGGVKTKLCLYPGVPHAHWGFFPMLKKSRQFRADQIMAFGWLLGREPAVWEGMDAATATSA